MKHRAVAIVSVLLSAAICAGADAPTCYANGSQTSVYYAVGRQRTDAELQAAAQICDARVGPVQYGSETSEPYRQCMLAQGWEYGYTNRSRADTYPYPDPDNPGLVCHDFTIFGIVGSSCSNF